LEDKHLATLEFPKIIRKLAALADSPSGKSACLSLRPHTRFHIMTRELDETDCALNLILKKNLVSFAQNRDISESLLTLKSGGSLNAAALLALADVLECAARVSAYAAGFAGDDCRQGSMPASKTQQGKPANDRSNDAVSGSDGFCLGKYFKCLYPLNRLTNEIRRAIISEEEIADDASPGLKSVRHDIKLTKERVRSELNSFVGGAAKSYLQEAIVTIRYDRYCVPVKAECKSQVPGMIHDQSASGSTFFIEPQAVVNLNNRLRELSSREKAEIEKVLEKLSTIASENYDEICADVRNLTQLDFVFAKAKLALDQNAIKPVYGKKKIIEMRGARHPLLEKDTCVPIDVYLGQSFDMLVVTGPNTGGKTVALKTLGLLTLMGQAGLFIPAKDRSRLAFFKEVFADIGDEQSIEQSLSTFSSHMTRIVDILGKANTDTLCLFDELGAGTDPAEGAALAISILSYLHERQIRTMASTHYSELKLFALETPGVENASCEFDIDSLRPTYKLIIGIPGKSNAFAISEKLGLPKRLIEDAGRLMGKKERNFEQVFTDLEISRKNLETERAEARLYRERIKTLEEQLRHKQEKLESQRYSLIKEAKAEALSILGNAKATADRAIREFRDNAFNSDIREMEKRRRQLRVEIKELEKSAESLEESEAPIVSEVQNALEKIRRGSKVESIDSGLKGVAVSDPDDRGDFVMRCGIIESKTNVAKVRVIADSVCVDGKPVASYIKTRDIRHFSEGDKDTVNRAASMSCEINLIGKTIEEALYSLDEYLDDAYISRMPSVRVVHGKGSGRLRAAVTQHLRKIKYVKSYRAGEFGEGDSGVTVVELGE